MEISTFLKRGMHMPDVVWSKPCKAKCVGAHVTGSPGFAGSGSQKLWKFPKKTLLISSFRGTLLDSSLVAS